MSDTPIPRETPGAPQPPRHPHADIFKTGCDAIVNPVNCVGVMGGGLAKQFRLRYPDMNKAYQLACAEGLVKVGKMWQWYEAPEFTKSGNWIEGRWVINFPTKDDWRSPSKIEYIREGLKDLVFVIKDLVLKSIAIPALGAGLGGLDWAEVEPLIIEAMRGLPLQRVEVYPPQGSMYVL